MTASRSDDWADWSDEALLEFEQSLYDDEVSGDDCWYLRDQVICEINRRGLWD